MVKCGKVFRGVLKNISKVFSSRSRSGTQFNYFTTLKSCQSVDYDMFSTGHRYGSRYSGRKRAADFGVFFANPEL